MLNSQSAITQTYMPNQLRNAIFSAAPRGAMMKANQQPAIGTKGSVGSQYGTTYGEIHLLSWQGVFVQPLLIQKDLHP